MIKRMFLISIIASIVFGIHIYRNIFVTNLATQSKVEAKTVGILINPDMTFNGLIDQMTSIGLKTPLGIDWYAKYTGFDRNLQPGKFDVPLPVTVSELFKTLSEKTKTETLITILPGWDLRDVANYLVKQKIAQNVGEVYALLGKPAEYTIPNISPTKTAWITGKPSRVSLEGYLAPDTFSIYNTATLAEVIDKLLDHRKQQLLPLADEIKKSGRSLHEIMTMAALLEREVRTPKDKAIVADIFWKRHDVNMGLQADSTVHYATAKEGSVFTSNTDRASVNPWNTYKYPGLPPGPIAFPSMASIEAALRPTKNDYWYFLTTLDTGEVKYGKTLAEHNANVQKYLRK
ncbi:MAG: endolytic transglycosylase MltG [Candidatus Magasanikbacteria bacterium]|nr:endolytic transglycosylase MltG [Candidatus Magasanikbacteria bacterium]